MSQNVNKDNFATHCDRDLICPPGYTLLRHKDMDMTQDQTDFVNMLAHYNPTIAQYAREAFDVANPDPRIVAAGLETVAVAARQWCLGRFGAGGS